MLQSSPYFNDTNVHRSQYPSHLNRACYLKTTKPMDLCNSHMISYMKYTTSLMHRIYFVINFTRVHICICFTWYDIVIWECSRHWKGQLITVVWSRKLALQGSLSLHSRGVVSGILAKASEPVAPSGQRSSEVNNDWRGASLSIPNLNWVQKPCRRRTN